MGWGAHVGVAAATALGVTCLAGGPLYVSSAATAALQAELADTCLSDAGLQVNLFASGDDEPLTASPTVTMREAAERVPYAQPVVFTDIAVLMGTSSDGIRQAATVVARLGQLAALGLDPLAPGTAAIGVAAAQTWSLPPGAVLRAEEEFFTVDPTNPRLRQSETVSLDLKMDQQFADIPVYPEPSFWCGLRNSLRPGSGGDPAPPLLLVDRSTLADAGWYRTVVFELRPDPDGLTRAEARALAASFDDLVARYEQDFGSQLLAGGGEEPGSEVDLVRSNTQLPVLLERSENVAEVVGRTVGPVRLAGIIASAGVLFAAGTLVARSNAADLRLRLLRGASPTTLAARTAAGSSGPVIAGAVVGYGLATAGVSALGPATRLERPPFARPLSPRWPVPLAPCSSSPSSLRRRPHAPSTDRRTARRGGGSRGN